MQLAARALNFLVDQSWKTFDFTDMALAPNEVKLRFAKLRTPDHTWCCKCCGKSMNRPGAIVADAGQAYEAIDMAMVTAAINALCKTAEIQKQPKTINVKIAKKACVSFGGSLDPKFGNRMVYTRDTIRQFAITMLLMRVFKIGFLYAAQLSGFATGGPWSPNSPETRLGLEGTWL